MLLIFSISCNDANEERLKEEWVINEVQNLIAEFRAEKINDCLTEIIHEVEIVVDSILSDKDLFSNIVDEEIPDKPTKPEYVPLDSIALRDHDVKPIVE